MIGTPCALNERGRVWDVIKVEEVAGGGMGWGWVGGMWKEGLWAVFVFAILQCAHFSCSSCNLFSWAFFQSSSMLCWKKTDWPCRRYRQFYYFLENGISHDCIKQIQGWRVVLNRWMYSTHLRWGGVQSTIYWMTLVNGLNPLQVRWCSEYDLLNDIGEWTQPTSCEVVFRVWFIEWHRWMDSTHFRWGGVQSMNYLMAAGLKIPVIRSVLCTFPDQYILIGADEGLYTLNLNEIHEASLELVSISWQKQQYILE